MNLLKMLFGSKNSALNKPVVTSSGEAEIKSKYDGFDIEELPHAGRYFPRYKGRYMYFWHTKQNYELQSNISGAVYSRTKEGAKKHIDRYLELRGVSTNIISVE